MHKSPAQLRLCFALTLLMLGGCTGIREYFNNDCKVGPGYRPPCAPVAGHWIDANDQRVRTSNDDLAGWWTVFGDPLDEC